VAQEVGDEVVVYDPERAVAHRLNRTAALVYRQADGTRSAAELAALVETELGTREAEALVDLATAHLEQAGLLEERGMSGMQKGLLVGAGLALLVPVVETLRAPTPTSAFSF
jgi:hypothetical protein